MVFLRWIKWLIDGKPAVHYTGYHCGCCGRWVEEPFHIPTYKSEGSDADTIGLCRDECLPV